MCRYVCIYVLFNDVYNTSKYIVSKSVVIIVELIKEHAKEKAVN